MTDEEVWMRAFEAAWATPYGTGALAEADNLLKSFRERFRAETGDCSNCTNFIIDRNAPTNRCILMNYPNRCKSHKS